MASSNTIWQYGGFSCKTQCLFLYETGLFPLKRELWKSQRKVNGLGNLKDTCIWVGFSRYIIQLLERNLRGSSDIAVNEKWAIIYLHWTRQTKVSSSEIVRNFQRVRFKIQGYLICEKTVADENLDIYTALKTSCLVPSQIKLKSCGLLLHLWSKDHLLPAFYLYNGKDRRREMRNSLVKYC